MPSSMENSPSKKVLVLGSMGMLGQELVRVFSAEAHYQVTAWDRDEIDATDGAELRAKFMALGPDVVFNAIAYNAVDLCETSEDEWERAKQLNVELPRNLATFARELGATLVHYSTDYVFGGEAGRAVPYVETDIPAPVQRYGRTKSEGEQAVLTVGGKVYIIRLSKLFGRPAVSTGGKKSFFGMMLEFGRTKTSVQAVDGERSCFTYAPDLAVASRALVEDGATYDVYHLVNEGIVTWYEGVRELYRLAGIETEVVPVPSGHFPRPAARPEYSALANTKRPKLRPYTEALAAYIRQELS